jgi:hypothetical protein
MSYRVEPRAVNDYAWPIRHSVDQKAALNWNIAESAANRTWG